LKQTISKDQFTALFCRLLEDGYNKRQAFDTLGSIFQEVYSFTYCQRETEHFRTRYKAFEEEFVEKAWEIFQKARERAALKLQEETLGVVEGYRGDTLLQIRNNFSNNLVNVAAQLGQAVQEATTTKDVTLAEQKFNSLIRMYDKFTRFQQETGIPREIDFYCNNIQDKKFLIIEDDNTKEKTYNLIKSWRYVDKNLIELDIIKELRSEFASDDLAFEYLRGGSKKSKDQGFRLMEIGSSLKAYRQNTLPDRFILKVPPVGERQKRYSLKDFSTVEGNNLVVVTKQHGTFATKYIFCNEEDYRKEIEHLEIVDK
jgi:hypothetical protein